MRVPTPLPRPRDDLAGFEPYRTQQMAADVRLQSNEWAEPNPASAYLTPDELSALLINRYPPSGAELREALAARWGVLPEQILFGNGSNEVLLDTFLAFGGHGRTTLLFEPTYSMHARLARIAGGAVVQELVGLPYDLTPQRALAAMERVRPAIVAFCTPNNPTGNAVPEEVIRSVAARWPETLVLVDEAYADFGGVTLVPAISALRNLVVAKTFSKARAAAGLRLGVLVADPQLAGAYRAVQRPYGINAVTLAVALRIVRDEAALDRRVATARSERARIAGALARVGVEVFPSEANFILFRMKDRDAAGTHGRLLEHGVLIRDVSSAPGCAGCLRVTVGTPTENDRFLAAIESVVRTGAPR